MESLREAQHQRWLKAKEEEQARVKQAPTSTPTTTSANDSVAGGSASSSTAQPSSATSAAAHTPNTSTTSASQDVAAGDNSNNELRSIRRIHILPLSTTPDVPPSRRLEVLAPELRRLRAEKARLKSGNLVRVLDAEQRNVEFIVVKCDPDEGYLTPETDYFVDGEPIATFDKVQFICLWDYESPHTQQDPTFLFTNYISPYFASLSDADQDIGNIVFVADTMKIFDLEFQVMAAEPSREAGIVNTKTMVYVDWDNTPEFEKIHIVPFQDTLPGAYDFDIFNDYLKPYLTKYKHTRFAVNDQFTFQGVQFKVVCCEPTGPARIGRNTTIYCEGVLHPSLRNLLPPELLEQLSNLPPGLQMLLLNTEALAGGYEERLMEVQEMLTRRNGMSAETINQVVKFRWGQPGHEQDMDSQSQCMVCLSDFSADEEVRKLPCCHIFHANCIDEWLRRCTDCPICKQNVDRAVRQY